MALDEQVQQEPPPDLPGEEPASGGGGRRGRIERRLPRYAWSGIVVALLMAASSFTPSLLPRTWYLQGLIAGIAGAMGYAIGVTGAWLVREVTTWRPAERTRRRAWRIVGWAAIPFTAATLLLGWRVQVHIHELVSKAAPAGYDSLAILVLGLLTFVALVALSRLLRRFTRWTSRKLLKVIPARLTRPLAVVVVTLVVIGILNGVIFRTFVSVSNSVFSVRDGATTEGTEQPSAPERSGSPQSLIGWDTLGRKGRDFTGGGPTVAQISSFSGRPATEPVRIYAGLQSAPTVEDRVHLAIKDLNRAGGFTRKALVVVTTTGTGWVDEASVDTAEYMLGGDTAIVAMQYSYLPSWISFLVDKSKAQETGAALFNGIYDYWSTLPEASRPKLYAFGESLGTFGGETAFSGLADVRNRTDGIVFAGPPNFNVLWSSLMAGRDPGSLERLPVYQQGQTVRWAATPADLGQPPTPWPSPRMLYVQHASDPVVWWSPHLLLHQPDWLREPRGADVSGSMDWLPWVTFWQVSADLAFSTGVPPGHGHVYKQEYVDAWAAVAQPGGWTAEDTTRLREIIH